ncbi:DNA-directed RNA polymerase III subunit RPC8 [Gregarina niphandrodes]|uniref:DNA-directed RNA polymerase III subunit RPC8 n=1 Tax=Gregarina niphandrodes TaxID=110365 RepID=A0A023BCI6_GRENI|nr:DNA-directed RNA polymerase III subunit RPC8 [Gregarina niphandrodes]EZG84061.1 DNA-directed RNA polymerase III subunit RPC8 [Gregarina niphandrodes]|eukprot:XP_011128879.1 DNA-directed RNA polymerase III subunit RPC8 [Gregarina niphandrodes]
MYVLGDFNDRVILDCDEESLGMDGTVTAIRRKLDLKYIDRVMSGRGLCVMINQILQVEPMPILGPNDGRTCYRVVAEVILFKPLPREVLLATIISGDALGLRLSTGFFQDIRIPAHMLPTNSKFDEGEGQWKWVVEGVDRNQDLYFEIGALCRFRVVDLVFSNDKKDDSVPMLLIGTVNDSGLGLDIWWV